MARKTKTEIRPMRKGPFNNTAKSKAKMKELTGYEQTLTQREREVLWFIAQGFSNANVAGALGLGEDTVRRHVSNILRKINATNRVQAALFAIRVGIAPLWPS